jgi:putative intracellular protease/amidase
MPTDKSSLKALKNLISEVDLILETTPDLPQNRTGRSRELLHAALALTDDLIKQAKMPAATAMGHIGGSATVRKYGNEHFRQLAAQRKTHGGGRPRNA